MTFGSNIKFPQTDITVISYVVIIVSEECCSYDFYYQKIKQIKMSIFERKQLGHKNKKINLWPKTILFQN